MISEWLLHIHIKRAKRWRQALLAVVMLSSLADETIFARTPDIDNIQSIKLALEDNPNELLIWARQGLQAPGLERKSKTWVRLIFAEAAALGTNDSIESLSANLAEAEKFAMELGLMEEVLLLREIRAGLIWDLGEGEASENAYAQLSQQAADFQLPHLEARYLALHGYLLMQKGDYNAGLKLMTQSASLIQKHPNIPELDRMNIQSAVAQSFASGQDRERAMAMDHEVEAYSRREKLRSMQATSLHNLALLYEEKGDPESLKKAEDLYQQGLKISRQLGKHYTEGPSLMGLSAIAAKQGRLQESEVFALESARTYSDEASYWKAEALEMAASSQFSLKKLKTALDTLKQAEEATPKDLKRMLVKIYDLRSQVEEALGDHQDALKSLRLHQKLYREMNQTDQKSTYSQSLAQLGMELEEQKNQALLRENELQGQKIQATEQAQKLLKALLVAATGLVLLLMFGIWKASEVRRRKFKMQRILNHIDEGILTINRHLSIEGEYSQYLLKFLQTEAIAPGSDAVSILFDQSLLSDEERSMIREALRACLNETSLAWELNESHFPHQVSYGPVPVRVASLHWVPIFSTDGLLIRVLLGLRDVTERIQLEQEVKQHRLRLNQEEEKIGELLDSNTAQAQALIEDSLRWLSSPVDSWQDPHVRTAAKRFLHTSKGNARSLGLWQLSHATHHLEDGLKDDFSLETWLTMKAEWGRVVQEYYHILHDIFQRHQPIASGTPVFLSDILRPFLPEIKARLEQSEIKLESLVIDDSVVDWDPSVLRKSGEIFMHALSNAADHGFIRPKQTQSFDRCAKILMTARTSGAGLELEIVDNGAGLSLNAIQERAQMLGRTLPEPNPFQILFDEGFTTAGQLSETSGRGVGLSAIFGVCQELGGQAQIRPAPTGPGTSLLVQLPLSPQHANNAA